MMNPFIRLGSLLMGKTTKELIIGLYSCVQTLHKIYLSQGSRGLAIRLKASSTYLMKSWSGDPLLDCKAFGPTMSLTPRGIPIWIPSAWRCQISSRNLAIFRVTMTLCNLYRVLPYQGKLKLSTITDDRKGSTPDLMFSFIKDKFAPNITNRVPYPGIFSWDPKPLLTRGPGAQKEKNTMSGFGMALRAIHETGMLDHLKAYALYTGLNPQLESLKVIWEGTRKHCSIGPIGKLAFKQEPGKVRVFAMVDCITQWFLHPLHKYLFSVLRTTKEDATFDQEKGINLVRLALSKKLDKSVFSFDLSAATDRLPMDIQMVILNSLTPFWLAEKAVRHGVKGGLGDAWADLLVDRDYYLPRWSGYARDSKVRYAVGQPMGALSSWAMLALTHHMIVQFAAASVGVTGWFKEYMVLGDDIVIYNSEVAKAYSTLMGTLGVGISDTKSLTSKIGVFEFAKRLMDLEGPCQGLPLAEFAAARFNLSILFQSFRSRTLYPKISTFMRFLGFGYKVLGSLGMRLGDMRKRSGYFETVAYSPLVTDKSVNKWSEFFKRFSTYDLYPLVEACVYKAYHLIPALTKFDRWNLWRTLFPHFDDKKILLIPEVAGRHLESLFTSMLDNKVAKYKADHSVYVNRLNRAEVPTNDWEAIDTLLSIMETSPPTSDLLQDPDMNELGFGLSVSNYDEDNKSKTCSLSLPYTVFTKIPQLLDSIDDWVEPIIPDKHPEVSADVNRPLIHKPGKVFVKGIATGKNENNKVEITKMLQDKKFLAYIIESGKITIYSPAFQAMIRASWAKAQSGSK
ncbi:RNA-dependent RNA polymerase [Tuber aestivum mitovirus]|uniref:RNA-dependent RNA polymerase n=1 Tax=Tuber aestivum mitovirus TaxID=1037523 RepID=F6LFY6_9VIRU|nr:RNA-dependent RNA polymerase [Tuber aestivum mitovirus]AEG79311.1 RNA-dependent RNA polymerase [Tuber aestivum mitovirus]